MTPNSAAPASAVPDGDEARAGPSLSRRALLGTGTAALAALAGCTGDNASVVVGKRDESESTYDLAEGSLRVDARYGDVTVRPADADRVRVEVVKSASVFGSLSGVEVTSGRDGDSVVVRSRTVGDDPLDNPPNVDVTVEVPPGVVVEAMDLRHGDARLRDVTVAAGTTVRSTNGDAVARGTDGDVECVTVNGDAVAEDVAGFVRGASENGGVVLRRADGVVGGSTRNGDVEVDVTAVQDDATFQSRNGDVTAALAPDLDAHLVARSSNGDVEARNAPGTVETNAETYFEGTVGDGSHDVEFVTTNGDVELARLS